MEQLTRAMFERYSWSAPLRKQAAGGVNKQTPIADKFTYEKVPYTHIETPDRDIYTRPGHTRNSNSRLLDHRAHFANGETLAVKIEVPTWVPARRPYTVTWEIIKLAFIDTHMLPEPQRRNGIPRRGTENGPPSQLVEQQGRKSPGMRPTILRILEGR